MKEHIEKLQEAMHGSTVFYALAYGENGPDVGGRKYGNEQRHVDDIILDNTVWMIASDVYHKDTNKRMTSVRAIHESDIADLTVHLRAQGMVCDEEGCRFEVLELGEFEIVERHPIDWEFGILLLK